MPETVVLRTPVSSLFDLSHHHISLCSVWSVGPWGRPLLEPQLRFWEGIPCIGWAIGAISSFPPSLSGLFDHPVAQCPPGAVGTVTSSSFPTTLVSLLGMLSSWARSFSVFLLISWHSTLPPHCLSKLLAIHLIVFPQCCLPSCFPSSFWLI